MSIKHAKIDGDLFKFNGLTEDVATPIPPESKKKKKRDPFYVKAFDKFSSGLDTKVAKNTTAVDPSTTDNISGSIFDKSEIIYNNNNRLRPLKGAQIAQPIEDSYKSIWKNPRIRPNTDFEFEEEMEEEEETFFDDDDEADYTIKVSPSIYKHYMQPETPSSFVPKVPQEEAQEVPVEEESVSVGEKIYASEANGEYVEVVDELQNLVKKLKSPPEKTKKESLLENFGLFNASLSSEEIDTVHKNSNDLYYTEEERITDKPINEV